MRRIEQTGINQILQSISFLIWIRFKKLSLINEEQEIGSLFGTKDFHSSETFHCD